MKRIHTLVGSVLAVSLAAAAIVARAGVATAPPGAGGPPKLTLAYFPNVTHAAALVGMQRGLFARALAPHAVLNARAFTAGPALIEALLAGEVDIGYVGPNPAINGYLRSGGTALRIIAGASSGGAMFIVRPDAGIHRPEDLAGKAIATPQRGGTQDVALRHYLKNHRLASADEGGSVTIVPTANPEIITLFRRQQIHGAWVPEPWATRLLLEAGGVVFLDERTEWPAGRFSTTVVVASARVLDEQPDAVGAFLGAHLDALAFLNANPEAAKQAVNDEIARITTRPMAPAVIDGGFRNVEFTYEPLAETLQVQADAAFALGFLGRTVPDLRGLLSLSLLNRVLTSRALSTVS